MSWNPQSKTKPSSPIAALTAYDYPTAKLLDEAGIDLILVGDSLGMVFMGLPDTTGVTMEHMVHHTTAASRGVTRAVLAADLPIHSYETPAQALTNARRLLDAGATAVKLEGPLAPQITTLAEAGIPVIAHLGMQPQQVVQEGGYSVKGRTPQDRQRLLQEATLVTKAGACALVLELVQHSTAAAITEAIPIPTIGIGSGPHCNGQILVTHDLVGLFPWFRPRFVQPEAALHHDFSKALAAYIRRTKRQDGSDSPAEIPRNSKQLDGD